VKFGNEPLRIASNLTRYLINRRVATWDAHTNINGASRI
jgi:hypothetical protein